MTTRINKLNVIVCLLAATAVLGTTNHAVASPYSDAVLADSPVAYYRFEDANANNGSTALNSATTGAAIDGTYTGSGFSLPANSFHTNLGNAVDVSSSSYVLATNNSALDLTTAATLEAWINAPPSGTNQNTWARIISKERTEAYQLYFINQTGNIAVETNIQGGLNPNFLQDTNDLRGTGWTHVVATFDGAGWDIYLDGVLSVFNTDTDIMATNTDPLNLFRDANGGDVYTGLADEIAIYNTALSPARIAAHFAAATAAAAAPTVPEPSTLVLASIGLLGLLAGGRRRRR